MTLITYGGSLPKALTAADDLAAEGIDAEVIDLRVLRPLDVDAILAIGREDASRGDRRREAGAAAASPPR